jgi:hypothetical protein
MDQCVIAFAISHRKTKNDLTTAIVPAGTSLPAVGRELSVSVYDLKRQPPLMTI